MVFQTEAQFEEAVIENLKRHGWDDEGGVLLYTSEQQLIDNWAGILFENNKEIDRLNGVPLTQGEMAQILEQVIALRTPFKLNGFINSGSVAITRDNPEDQLHYGKEVSLYVFDRKAIAGGPSRYQIAQQPRFGKRSEILNERRGDVMLLINGMPVIHIELKRSGVDVMQAANQIEKYSFEGVFSGIFSLVQIFVAMTPEETLYFSNPGPDGTFNRKFYFHWADFNNIPINSWKEILASLLSIPLAHQFIGSFTVADGGDSSLKVMRSYQYIAANRIADKVFKIDRTKAWGQKGTMGGYVWHTTGSGKTMTSFKSAQLIANSKDADKVVFLVDRIELGTQSLSEYRAFAGDLDDVQATESTDVLKAKLKSDDPSDTLIVTSIQKMSNISEDDMKAKDLDHIRRKRIVFIVDECHRSTFGEMMLTIRDTFPAAVFFGFTGTPIQEENQKKLNTTSDIFGEELHRYSIADGIRDGNVLGFDPYKVLTFKDFDVRREVAIHEAKAEDEHDAISDPMKSRVYYCIMDAAKVPMAGQLLDDGSYLKGIEDYLPEIQYGIARVAGEPSTHSYEVAKDIIDHWPTLSRYGKFHAIFATHSIPEAINYYRLFKAEAPDMKVTALFDPSIDNDDGVVFKEEGLVEILQDYNRRYEQDFTIATHAGFKKDVAARLAHKTPYVNIGSKPEETIDILIVVDQMLTGFDSKWINTLYLDKVLRYEMIIQAFSRTNRIFYGDEKPNGVIRYYRRPHTMEKNIEAAVKLYSGDRPFGLFVPKLGDNLHELNRIYDDLCSVFSHEGIDDFSRLPDEVPARGRFASLFKELNATYEAARLQGFTWEQNEYSIQNGDEEILVVVAIDEGAFLSLAQRYKELAKESGDGSDGLPTLDIPYEIDGYLTEIDTGRIDNEYMNANFIKWLKNLEQENVDEDALNDSLAMLHKSFASLSQEEQKYANLFLHDVQSGDIKIDPSKSVRDYIIEYQSRAKEDQVGKLVAVFGVEREAVEELLRNRVTEDDINEFARFDHLMEGLDTELAIAYFSDREGHSIPGFKARMKADALLRKFILEGGFDI